MPSGRIGSTAVWTGSTASALGRPERPARKGLLDGLAYNPRTNRWSTIPAAPLRRGSPVMAWTGHALIVWGGVIGTPLGTNTPPKFPRDGAFFTPATQ